MQDIFIKRLVELMEEKNINQLELSKLVGTTNVTISRYISGQRKPRLEIIAKIAEILNTSIEYLLGFSDIKNFTTSKSSNLLKLQNTLKSLGLLNSNYELADSQIQIIEKLIEENKNLFNLLDDNSKEA